MMRIRALAAMMMSAALLVACGVSEDGSTNGTVERVSDSTRAGGRGYLVYLQLADDETTYRCFTEYEEQCLLIGIDDKIDITFGTDKDYGDKNVITKLTFK